MLAAEFIAKWRAADPVSRRMASALSLDRELTEGSLARDDIGSGYPLLKQHEGIWRIEEHRKGIIQWRSVAGMNDI